MQRLTRCSVLLSLLALLGTWFAPRLAAQMTTVRCESHGTTREQCPIPSNSRVAIVRTLSREACREGHNWGVGTSFIWVNGGCRADFAVTNAGYEPGPGNATANRNQLRACQSEADRRMPAYSYDQITVEPDSREGSVAYVRWRAGPTTGLCAVEANGRILQFITNPAGTGVTTRIVCQSQRTGREKCLIPAGARIRLLRQTSQSPCRLNDTYGQGPDYIWVAEGCRGEFEVVTAGGGGGPGPSRIVCASAVNTRRQCAIPPGARVRLVRQMSEVPCRTSQNWGVGPDFVWVTRGCAAEFEVTGAGGGWQGGNGGGTGTTRIVCESRTAARVQCQVAGATAIRLVKQYSTNPCLLNQSFGIGFGHIWVSSGCRGEFEVVTRGNAPGGGTGLPERVLCESKGGERTECRIRVGGQVRLARQISTTQCTQNNTWGYGYGMIWVTKGCRGEFEVR